MLKLVLTPEHTVAEPDIVAVGFALTTTTAFPALAPVQVALLTAVTLYVVVLAGLTLNT